MTAVSVPSAASFRVSVVPPFFSEVVRRPDSLSNLVHLPEKDVVAPAKRLTEIVFLVVWDTWTADESVFTPQMSVLYRGTDATNTLP